MMLTEAERKQRRTDGFNAWYEKNKSTHNAIRRMKYAASDYLRKQAQDRAATYRASNQKITRKLTRKLDGVSVPVFSTGQLASQAGCSVQLIVKWRKEGVIPPPIFPGKHHVYTKQQMDLIVALKKRYNKYMTWDCKPMDKAVGEVTKAWSG